VAGQVALVALDAMESTAYPAKMVSLGGMALMESMALEETQAKWDQLEILVIR